MKKILSIFIICFALQGCNSNSKDAELVYNRSDINTDVSFIVVLPTTTPDGTMNSYTKLVSASIYLKWASIYGKKAIPAEPVIEKIFANSAMKNAYIQLVSSMNNAGTITGTLQNTAIKLLLSAMNKKLGIPDNSRYALSTMTGTEADYNNGKPVQIKIGLFDVNESAWKVITKTEDTKNGIANFKLSYNGIVNNHFTTIKNNIETAK